MSYRLKNMRRKKSSNSLPASSNRISFKDPKDAPIPSLKRRKTIGEIPEMQEGETEETFKEHHKALKK